eukprot:TRINITY_DN32234_c0_g1_i1.p1 TRINITY_DN32234_c0_g1~~TRINITY_DN32234_c0_g1_i1.p1  ORF type:complete len:511 (+),score=63.23 TRINITY_DN32234_c0_g1_i1:69-1601(+)
MDGVGDVSAAGAQAANVRIFEGQMAYGSTQGPSPEAKASFPKRGATLPDLTQQLKNHGIYGEYLEFLRRYQHWRKGGAIGARGELSHQFLESQYKHDPYKFECWYPTANAFQWHFTISYWISTFYLLGSFIFLVSGAIICCNGHGGPLMKTWPAFLGSCMFTIGTYLTYLQVINVLKKEDERLAFVWCDWLEVRKKLSCASITGALGYFYGALLFQVAQTAPLWPLSPSSNYFLVRLMNLFGSLGFLIGSISETVHNRVMTAVPSGLAWWASLLNLTGSISFVAASAPSVLVPSFQGRGEELYLNIGFIIGFVFFAVASILCLLMWRADDFGLTLLSQLNLAVKADAALEIQSTESGQIGVQVLHHRDGENSKNAEAHSNQLSIRGVFFIVVYIWFICMAMVDCVIEGVEYTNLSRTLVAKDARLRAWTGFGMHTFVVLIVFIVLIIHSVVVQIPSREPFRSAMILGRCTLVAGAVCQSVDVIGFLCWSEHLDWNSAVDEMANSTAILLS